MRPALILLLILVAPGALAGAWLQEHKKGFLSLSGVYDEYGRIDGTLYVEYGLRPKLTLGVKADGDMTLGRLGNGTAFVFARKPILVGERAFKLAYEVGVGSTFGESSTTLLRTGLSYGRGIRIGQRYGWVAVDAIAEVPLSEGTDTYKFDSTVGLTINDSFKVMMQVFLSVAGDTSTTTVAPAVIWQPKGKGPSYVLGVEDEDGILALKLGIWQTF